MDLLGHILLVCLAGYGMAVFLVEKKKDAPARKMRVYLKYWLRKVSKRAPNMLACTVCTSFWTTLIAELLILPIDILRGHVYFLWPLTGFVTLGLTWTVMDLINSLFLLASKENK